ncbi:MAG: hypothetical protein U0487_02920 [Patescibacteria group bacterium]
MDQTTDKKPSAPETPEELVKQELGRLRQECIDGKLPDHIIREKLINRCLLLQARHIQKRHNAARLAALLSIVMFACLYKACTADQGSALYGVACLIANVLAFKYVHQMILSMKVISIAYEQEQMYESFSRQ